MVTTLGLTCALLCVGVCFGHPSSQQPRPAKYDDGTVGMRPGKMPRALREEDVTYITQDEAITQTILKHVAALFHPDSNNTRGLLPPVSKSYGRVLQELFPGPSHKPGDVMNSVDVNKINDALDEVHKAASWLQDEKAAIGHANVAGHPQLDPRYYLYSGVIHAFIPPSIVPGQTSLMLFSKAEWSLAGSVGVYTYDVKDTDHKIAVMWSVPFDDNIYDKWFNMKVYPKSYATGKGMYEQMYYYAGPWRPAGYEYRTEKGVELKGSMTDNDESKLAIWSNTTVHDPSGGVELWTDCDYHAGWVWTYCWQECYPSGWCWVNKKCGSKSDCQGPLECYTGC